MTSKVEIELKLMFYCDKVTREDIQVIKTWVEEMERYGPEHIKNSPEWHDHPLQREWFGHRSSAFSSSGRIIYKVFEDKILIQIRKVTPDHNYEK